MNQTFAISGMHCGACAGRVTAALKPYAGDVTVTLDPPRAVLTNSRGLDLAKLNSEVGKAGAYALKPLEDSEPSPAFTPPQSHEQRSVFEIYKPLIVIVGYIVLVAVASSAASGAFSWQQVMTFIMAGFFLVFSAFKFFNLSGFADAYATYDLLAKRWRAWGYIYPFCELALGIAYLTGIAPRATNLATFVLMAFSSLGVMGALRSGRKIQCACLGTVLKLPMSTVTLVEDLAMVAMAAMALVFGHN